MALGSHNDPVIVLVTASCLVVHFRGQAAVSDVEAVNAAKLEEKNH